MCARAVESGVVLIDRLSTSWGSIYIMTESCSPSTHHFVRKHAKRRSRRGTLNDYDLINIKCDVVFTANGTFTEEQRGDPTVKRARLLSEECRRWGITREEERAITSVVGVNGKSKNGECMNGCVVVGKGQQTRGRSGQKNMLLVIDDEEKEDEGEQHTSLVVLGKCCGTCMRQSEDPTAKKGRGEKRYLCQARGCQREGVTARWKIGSGMVPKSLRCGRCHEMDVDVDAIDRLLAE